MRACYSSRKENTKKKETKLYEFIDDFMQLCTCKR